MRRGHGPGRGGERGAAGIEMALAASAFLLATFLAVGALRISTTRSDVSASARSAARAAAQAYTPAQAEQGATAVAADVLASHGVACVDLRVRVGGELAPGSIVTATVVCQVDLADVALVGFPGSTEVEATAAEMVDVVRGGGS